MKVKFFSDSVKGNRQIEKKTKDKHINRQKDRKTKI